MTPHDTDPNGWQLEEDTEVRQGIDQLAQMLSVPPNMAPAGGTKRRNLVIKILVSITIVALSFVLGILYAQNSQLKRNSSALSGERAKLSEHIDTLEGTVDKCQDELTLCSEDVDLLQELSEYNLSPAEKYGKGYAAIQILQISIEEVASEQEKLQDEIEAMVKKIWRPSRISNEFWRELRQKVVKKRKLDRKRHRIEKKRLKAIAKLDEAFIEKKIHFKEIVKNKNEKRKMLALELDAENPPGTGDSASPKGVPAEPPAAAEPIEGENAVKQDLAAVVPQ